VVQESLLAILSHIGKRGGFEGDLVRFAVTVARNRCRNILIWRQRQLLFGLSLGEQVAESMGLNYRRGSRLIVLGAALLVGASVAVAGSIGFVGLVVPHLVRPLVNHRPDRLLLPSALAGASLVCLADIGVRLLPPGREIKLGVLTALIGAPLFIWLVWKDRKRWL